MTEAKYEWETITTQIHQWREEGQTLEGAILKVEPFTEGNFGNCNRYEIMTPDGELVSTILGSATDKSLHDHSIAIDDYVQITFKGVKPLEDGRRVNVFDIKRRKVAPSEKK